MFYTYSYDQPTKRDSLPVAARIIDATNRITGRQFNIAIEKSVNEIRENSRSEQQDRKTSKSKSAIKK